jgi:signal transduction histidine kinase/CheY-like chemotaxis protein
MAATGADSGLTPAGPTAPAVEARVQARVRERQTELVLAYLARLPYSNLGYLLIAGLAYVHGVRWPVAIWLAALAGLTFPRWRYGRRVAALPVSERARALPRLLSGFLVAGPVNAFIVPFMFLNPGPDFTVLAISAAFILVLVIGAEGVAGSQRAFLGMATPSALLLSLGWFMHGGSGWLIGAGLWIPFAMVWGSVRDRARSLHALMQTMEANAELSRVAEQERDRAREADAAKSRFLAAASHDLRQPMQAIGLFGAALENAVAGQPAEIHARRLMSAVRTLGDSLDVMLDISQFDAGALRTNPHPVPLQPLLEQLFNLYEPQANRLDLELRVRSSPLWVHSDAQLLLRLLGNLIDNALKYTTRGGVVLRARARGDQVWLDVRDTGIGIAPAHQERIFEEFYQVNNPGRDRSRGLGVGLPVVQRLAALLGHPLSLRSREGHGTRVRLALPAAEPPAEAAPAHEAPDTEPPPLPRRVLVLDDDDGARTGMLAFLASLGVSAQGAADPAQAHDALRRACDEGQPYELALCDWRLAEGADGLAAALQLRDSGAGTLRVVMVTGETDPQRLQQLRNSGLPVLFKPVEAQRLLRALAHGL